MNAGFGRQAERLAAIASQHAGWTPDVFWHSTPSELLTALADPSQPAVGAIDRTELDKLMELDRNG